MGTIPVIAAPPGAGNFLPNSYLVKIKQTVDFWGLTPRCYAYQSGSQTIPNNTYTAVTLDAEVYDIANSYDGGSDAGMHDLATNNTRVYARTAGKYEISGNAVSAINSTGIRGLLVLLNAAGNPAAGTQISAASQSALTGASTGVPLPVVEIPMAAGDYVEMFFLQNSGAGLALNTGQSNTFLRLKLTGS